ncbi:MAG: topoisomerase DNA-binding C4 zinc finger domain-containing protein, partial [Lachnospiraceae bacterium]|nr:topoisomerase DNA-binding C4 zinc finger domain-containing protein [Lachnospiraceae bacterium]
ESEILVCLRHAYNNNRDLCDIAFSILIPKDERRAFVEKMLGAPGPYYERPQELKEESTKSQTSVLPKEPDIQTGRYCPRCGSELLIRLARRGPNAGNQFVGCSAFPQCRYAESLSLREAYALGIAIPNKSGD